MYAPSARDCQPWHFVVITEREILDRLAEIHPYGKMLKQATLAILIAGDKNLEAAEGYINQGCAVATQNILLSAHAKGLGAVWLGVYPRQDRMTGMINFFELPENIIPISLISIGYPNEIRPQPERFKPERIHYEQW
jgi:nitroreductase